MKMMLRVKVVLSLLSHEVPNATGLSHKSAMVRVLQVLLFNQTT